MLPKKVAMAREKAQTSDHNVCVKFGQVGRPQAQIVGLVG